MRRLTCVCGPVLSCAPLCVASLSEKDASQKTDSQSRFAQKRKTVFSKTAKPS